MGVKLTAHKMVFSSFPRNHTKRFVRRHQQTHSSIQPVNEINYEVDCPGAFVLTKRNT